VAVNQIDTLLNEPVRDGQEVRIAPDGEILVRGESVVGESMTKDGSTLATSEKSIRKAGPCISFGARVTSRPSILPLA
jgi:hypothetical protein